MSDETLDDGRLFLAKFGVPMGILPAALFLASLSASSNCSLKDVINSSFFNFSEASFRSFIFLSSSSFCSFNILSSPSFFFSSSNVLSFNSLSLASERLWSSRSCLSRSSRLLSIFIWFSFMANSADSNLFSSRINRLLDCKRLSTSCLIQLSDSENVFYTAVGTDECSADNRSEHVRFASSAGVRFASSTGVRFASSASVRFASSAGVRFVGITSRLAALGTEFKRRPSVSCFNALRSHFERLDPEAAA